MVTFCASWVLQVIFKFARTRLAIRSQNSYKMKQKGQFHNRIWVLHRGKIILGIILILFILWQSGYFRQYGGGGGGLFEVHDHIVRLDAEPDKITPDEKTYITLDYTLYNTSKPEDLTPYLLITYDSENFKTQNQRVEAGERIELDEVARGEIKSYGVEFTSEPFVLKKTYRFTYTLFNSSTSEDIIDQKDVFVSIKNE
jgi:hypothetical protein